MSFTSDSVINSRGIFHKGDLVFVDKLLKAYIEEIHQNDESFFDTTFSIRYIIGNTMFNGITLDRVELINHNHNTVMRANQTQIKARKRKKNKFQEDQEKILQKYIE